VPLKRNVGLAKEASTAFAKLTSTKPPEAAKTEAHPHPIAEADADRRVNWLAPPLG
jgi:hypothetical protein